MPRNRETLKWLSYDLVTEASTMSASIHFSPSFSLAILPSLLVFLFWFFRKFALKGCILLAAKRRKKREAGRVVFSLGKSILNGKKKKKEKETKLLSPLAVNVIRPDFTLSQFSLMSKKIEPITTVSFSLSLSPQHFDRFVLTSIMRSSILFFYI